MPEAIDQLREKMPDAAKDIRLNLSSVLDGGSLDDNQRFGVAIACAYAARNQDLVQALLLDARSKGVTDAAIDDAKAAAALMAMNNVYYRFRHMVGKPSYAEKRPSLRMNRMMQVQTTKADFELFCLAVSAINGCETCVQSHEKVVIEAGRSEDQVHDAVRIASVIHAAAVSLELA